MSYCFNAIKLIGKVLKQIECFQQSEKMSSVGIQPRSLAYISISLTKRSLKSEIYKIIYEKIKGLKSGRTQLQIFTSISE